MQHTLWSSGAQQGKLQGGQVAKRGKSQAGAFAVVSGGRNGRGRVSRAGLAGLDHLWALGQKNLSSSGKRFSFVLFTEVTKYLKLLLGTY